MKNQNKIRSQFLFSLLLLIVFFILSYSKAVSHNVRVTLRDTTIKAKSKLRQEKDDGGPSVQSILQDELNSYHETIKVDTTFVLNGRYAMRVKLRHYCTYDSKINLPIRYLRMYNLSKFRTHDFISAIEVKIDSKLVFRGFIRKEDFNKLLDNELKNYGVLLYPNVEFSNNNLTIQYTISIPLTDVGKGFTIKIDTSGKKSVTVD